MKNTIARFRYKVLMFMLNFALDHLSKKSGTINHATRELTLAGFYTGDSMNKLIADQTIKLLKLFSTFGHSGFSSGMGIDLFSKLANFKIISALKLNDDEWNKVDRDINVKQNNRYGHIFMDDKGIYNVNAFVKQVVKSKFINEKDVIDHNGGTYTGTVFLCRAGLATGQAFRRCYVKPEHTEGGYIPKGIIYLPVTQIEVTSDDWLMFVDVKSLKYQEIIANYNIEYIEVPDIKNQPIKRLTHNYGY